MKIGIIGVPGSGKTELAKFIKESFPKYKIINGYVEKLSKKIDTAAGAAGSHYMNTAITIERINAELAVKSGNLITCGTLIETMAYDALYGLEVINQFEERQRIQTTMAWFGVTMRETYLYDRLFYLPDQSEEWADLDYQIEYAIALFKLKPVHVLGKLTQEIIEPLKKYEGYLDEAAKAFKR